MSIPPVVVGLLLYIIFSASGVLGFMDILYSPTIMIVANLLLLHQYSPLSIKTLSDQHNLLGQYLISLTSKENNQKNNNL